jgi:TQXA domain-containing protein/LPXTG-motif cell wall-anchored protein
MASRHRLGRLGALVLTAAVALLVTAPSASAASGTFIGDVEPGEGFYVKDSEGNKKSVWAALLGIDTDGNLETAELRTYCVEIDVQAVNEAPLTEAPWSEFPGDASVAKPDRVLWILHHSYPSVSVADLAEASGVEGLDNREAITGTQAAIWHFANGAEIHEDNPADIVALYEYLTGEANVGLEEQEPVTLTVTPEQAADLAAGAKAGPFTVQTTASEAMLTVDGPDGVKIVDADGNEIDSVTNGGKFWLTAPAGGVEGEAVVEVVAEEPQVAKGRLFIGASSDDAEVAEQPLGFSNSPGLNSTEQPETKQRREPVRTQTLVVADSTKSTAKDEVSANWLATPPPSSTTAPVPSSTTVAPSTTPPPQGGSLPDTGASVMTALIAGLVLLGVGGGIMVLLRRRRETDGGATS